METIDTLMGNRPTAAQVNQETGYNDYVECECRNCRTCQGEGELVVNWTQDINGNDVRLKDEAWIKCQDCQGTGKYFEDCPVHADSAGKLIVRAER